MIIISIQIVKRFLFLLSCSIYKIPLYFSAINKGDTKDTEMETIMDNIVESLFSVFVTLGKCKIS